VKVNVKQSITPRSFAAAGIRISLFLGAHHVGAMALFQLADKPPPLRDALSGNVMVKFPGTVGERYV
jgi:hypothetical protein